MSGPNLAETKRHTPDKYGITNAITLAAQKEETWEKSVELEKLGGQLSSLPIEEFKSFDG